MTANKSIIALKSIKAQIRQVDAAHPCEITRNNSSGPRTTIGSYFSSFVVFINHYRQIKKNVYK